MLLRCSFALAHLGVILAVTSTALAQPEGPPPDERRIERVEQFRKVRLIEHLDLKEEQSVRFFSRMNEHEKVKRDLVQQKDDVMNRLERLVRNHGEEKEFDKLFADVNDLNVRLGEEESKFVEGLKDILTTEQRAKLILFERHFMRELREAMREVQRRRIRPDEH